MKCKRQTQNKRQTMVGDAAPEACHLASTAPGPKKASLDKYWIYWVEYTQNTDFNLSEGCFPICSHIVYKCIQCLYDF